MKIELHKITTAPVYPAEPVLEKGKEGISFAQAMENVLGLLEKTLPVPAQPKIAEEPVAGTSESPPHASSDLAIQTVLLCQLGQGAALPVPAVAQKEVLPVEPKIYEATSASQVAKVCLAGNSASSKDDRDQVAHYSLETREAPPTSNKQHVFTQPTAGIAANTSEREVVSTVDNKSIEAMAQESVMPPAAEEPVENASATTPTSTVITTTTDTAATPTATTTAATPTATTTAAFSAQSVLSESKIAAVPTLAATPIVTPRLVEARPAVYSSADVSVEISKGNLSSPGEELPPTELPKTIEAQPSSERTMPLGLLVPTELQSTSVPLSPREPPLKEHAIVAHERLVIPLRADVAQVYGAVAQALPSELPPAAVRSNRFSSDTTMLNLAGEATNISHNPLSTQQMEIAPNFMQRLNMEIISFAAHPTRPELTLEITPPEYGKVIVSAERERGGQVVVRLIAETPQAKMALIEQLPKSMPNLEVRVYTAEEYREQQGAPHREQSRERQEQPERQGKREDRVEFKI